MNNNNPAEMSNQDLEKEAEKINAESSPSGNQEKVNKSTAAEGTLKTPSEDAASVTKLHSLNKEGDERDLDDLVHAETEEDDSQDGSLPDPEEVGNWENNDDDDNKISS